MNIFESNPKINLEMILSTPKSTVCLMRNFGLSNIYIDSPTPKIMASLSKEILEQAEHYAVAIKIKNITYKKSNDICLRPIISYEVKHE